MWQREIIKNELIEKSIHLATTSEPLASITNHYTCQDYEKNMGNQGTVIYYCAEYEKITGVQCFQCTTYGRLAHKPKLPVHQFISAFNSALICLHLVSGNLLFSIKLNFCKIVKFSVLICSLLYILFVIKYQYIFWH